MFYKCNYHFRVQVKSYHYIYIDSLTTKSKARIWSYKYGTNYDDLIVLNNLIMKHATTISLSKAATALNQSVKDRGKTVKYGERFIQSKGIFYFPKNT